jgi:XXXCH domain-containing protein
MLESKKKLAQSFSDLKVAVEKGKGDPGQIFSLFEQGCRDFTRETSKLPPEATARFLELGARIGRAVQSGDKTAIIRVMDEMREMKKSCHEAYK